MPTIASIIQAHHNKQLNYEAVKEDPMGQMAVNVGGSGFNQQVQDMDQQLIHLQGRVNDLTSAVNTLVEVIGTLQKTVQRIENQLPPVAPPAKPGDRNLLV